MPVRWIRFLAQRIAAAAFTMAGAILLLFILIQFVPGDLITIMLGPRVTPELRAAFAERMGLDKSVLERLWL
ncbi:MAG TPA: ABC transporter permease, partial [Aestuariivirgaceae bacterium]